MDKFTIIILIVYVKDTLGKSINLGKTNITFGSYVSISGFLFNITPLKTIKKISTSECWEYCDQEDKCESIEMFYDTCRLFNESKHTRKEAFQEDVNTVYYSLKNVGCYLKKCKNNSTCIPNYENDTFECACQVGYSGKFCEHANKSAYPNWWFKFDGNTENAGSSKSDVTMKTLNTNDGVGSFSGQPHKVGMYLHCNRTCTENTMPSREWIDPDHAKDGLTVAFWIRFYPGEPERQANSYFKRSYIFATKNLGYTITYENKYKRWVFFARSWKVKSETWLWMEEFNPTDWHFIGFIWNHTKITGVVDHRSYTYKHSGQASSEPPTADPSEYVEPLLHPKNPCIFDMDDFRVWYRGLSKEEMRSLYAKEKTDMWYNV